MIAVYVVAYPICFVFMVLFRVVESAASLLAECAALGLDRLDDMRRKS